MNTKQQNQVTMYGAVLRFLEEAGKPLAAIKRIEAGRVALAGVVERIGQASAAQARNTTGITGDRQEVKAEAAQKAEVLRLLTVALTPDAAVRGELKTPLSKKLKGKEAEFLAYLQQVDDALGTLAAADLAEAGYDPAVRQTLRADLTLLRETKGQVRQVETGVSAATDTVTQLLAQANDALETGLDPFVRAQQLAQPELVRQYEAVRAVVKTAAKRGPEYRGVVQYGKPALVFDRREAAVAAPTLGNRSGKGLSLRYYTAASTTAAPAPGQGVVVKNKAEAHLADYSKLGVADAVYLLVVLEQVDGEGRWVVK